MRLDIFLSETRGISRNRAQFLISEGLVFVAWKVISKAAYIVENPELITVKEDDRVQFVARSAVKLDAYLPGAIGKWLINISWATCLDVGSSTGGFVQVLLKFGAKKVVALDVGTLQLHPTLRSDTRIVSIENTDFRDFDSKGEHFGVITSDVSFISLSKLLPAFARVASLDTKLVLLFKPQFEVGKENLTKRNLPKSDTIIFAAMKRFREEFQALGFRELDFRESELPGEEWNHEWIFLLEKQS